MQFRPSADHTSQRGAKQRQPASRVCTMAVSHVWLAMPNAAAVEPVEL